MTPSHPAQILFSAEHPLTKSLDIKFQGVVERTLSVTVSAPESFADLDGTHVHTGFNTLLLDTVMGSCVLGEMAELKTIATIKLTCNHLKQMKVGDAIICEAHFDGEENEIAYVTGRIFAGTKKELIATAIGTFMIGTTSKPASKKDKANG